MAYCGNDSSGEQFDTSPGSDPDDEYESAVGATFFVASKTWSSEQRTILQARLEDWKQTKSSKSRNLIIQGALKELGALPGALPIDEMKLSVKAWYGNNSRTMRDGPVGQPMSRRKVIMKLYSAEIDARLKAEFPDMRRGTPGWLGKYSAITKEVSERVRANTAEETKVQRLRKEWTNKGPPKDIRRRDAERLTSRRMHEFAHKMYVELGVRMVTLAAWVNPLAEKRWTIYDINDTIGKDKPRFTSACRTWSRGPLEKTFHQYVIDHLTGDEDEGKDGERSVVRPTGNAKPKVELASGDKGQPLLPSNCIRVHGDKARFLEYQKQVLRAYIERMYNLAGRRRSGRVPWREIALQQDLFIDQEAYMPLQRTSAPSRSRASTRATSVEDSEGSEAYIVLRDPSKMHKSDIEACFSYWLSRQEKGKKVAFAFSHVLGSGSELQEAVRLDDLSDVGGSDLDIPAPVNKPKPKPARKKGKARRREGPPAQPSSTAADVAGLLECAGLEWDHLDPILRPSSNMPNTTALQLPTMLPIATTTFVPPPPFSPGEDSNAPPVPLIGNSSSADPQYAGAVASIEHGGNYHSLLPQWVQQANTYASPPHALKSALRKPPALTPGQESTWQFPPAFQGPLTGPPGVEPQIGDETDTNAHWMKTRSKSRSKTRGPGDEYDTGAETHVSEVAGGRGRKQAPPKAKASTKSGAGKAKGAPKTPAVQTRGSAGKRKRAPSAVKPSKRSKVANPADSDTQAPATTSRPKPTPRRPPGVRKAGDDYDGNLRGRHRIV